MPPGERSPVQVGIILPSGVTRMAQPRNGLRLLSEPVRVSSSHRLPSRSNFDPMAYSW